MKITCKQGYVGYRYNCSVNSGLGSKGAHMTIIVIEIDSTLIVNYSQPV